jgi:spore germination protein GerM
MARTTLEIEDDALKVARAHAARHHTTLAKAVSELLLQSVDRPLVTDIRNGLRVVRLSRRSPKVATALVNKLRDEFP